MLDQKDATMNQNFDRPQSLTVPTYANSFKKDLIAGFLVFLIALPLCMGISIASGFPAVAGVFTAIVGALISPWFSNSELTIKGPAAGLIVIVLGCVMEFGFTGGQNPAADMFAYRAALAVGVAAGLLQLVAGLFRAGLLSELFPTATVHGMLAAIGVIIIAKQFPTMLGVSAKGNPLELLWHIPQHIANMNPEVAFIGVLSLFILVGVPLIPSLSFLRKIPGPMLVVLVATPLGMYFDFGHEHTFELFHKQYLLNDSFLPKIPNNLFKAMTTPDFSVLADLRAWKWVAMFTLIGSLESLLSSKAIDLLDPWKRKTSMNRDLIAVGVGNIAAAFVGGLPMISEIVRSRANIDNGARTRLANSFHGLFLLSFLALLPFVLHQIPLAALAAMLVYTGCRLASPKEFQHAYKIGSEQLWIFLSTLVGVLATDLLVGVLIGIGVKVLFHMKNGASLGSLFQPRIQVEEEERQTVLSPQSSAVFTNWISLRKQILKHGIKAKQNLCIDLSQARLVDHTVMSKLKEFEQDFEQVQLKLVIRGLEHHQTFSTHELSGRKNTTRESVLNSLQ